MKPFHWKRNTGARTGAAAAVAAVAALAACAEVVPDTNVESGEVSGAAGARRLGAIPHDGGTLFRVWAPNAANVFVTGDFNAWSATADPLVAEGTSGVWSADVAGALPGQEYKYVIQRPGGATLVKADPRASAMTNSVGNSVITDPDAFAWTASGYHTPAWNEAVVYEMHVGTFNDEPGGEPGTWLSAAAKLDHLAALGVNMLEVLPPAEFPGSFSWGYNPAFPFAPESAYGSPEDMKYFVDEAHRRGMGVVIDVVHNHWGPDDLAMWCFDGECYGSGNGGEYFYTDWRRESGWGPRPDYGRPEVRDYVVDNALMWLNEFHADGLRWDSTVNIRTASGTDLPDGWGLLQRVNNAVDGAQPWKLMIAEDLSNNEWLTKPTSGGGAGFDAQWDAAFFHPIDDTIIAADDGARSMWAVRDAITHSYNGRATGRVIYTESHDEVANGRSRIPEMIWPGHAGSYYSKKRSTLGAAIVMTSPGIPMLFEGQEFLEDGYFADGDPLDWTKAATYAGILRMYTDLIHLRRNFWNNTRGLRGNNVNVFHVNDTDKVVAYHRWENGGAGDDVVVLANFSARAFPSYEIGFPRGGTWHVRFNSDWTGYSSDFNNTPSLDLSAVAGPRDGLGYRGTVGVGPWSVVILSQ
jgi:1,4-alpha-glucan branching enzyme